LFYLFSFQYVNYKNQYFEDHKCNKNCEFWISINYKYPNNQQIAGSQLNNWFFGNSGISLLSAVLFFAPVGSRPGMEPEDGIPQVLPVQVGVNLRCQDGFMAEHFLNSTQVGPPFNQVGRK
jgi:hypothetical protein